MLSVSYASTNAYSASKTSGVLRGGALGGDGVCEKMTDDNENEREEGNSLVQNFKGFGSVEWIRTWKNC